MPTFARFGEREAIAALRAEAHELRGAVGDYDPLLELVGDARIVLLGEASHGTHEFYRERARITERLVSERGFSAVAIEGDWPDAHRANRYVHARSDDHDAEAALRDFARFPAWMWRNVEMLDFVGWMRALNEGRRRIARRLGLYGLDLYGLGASTGALIAYLEEHDPSAAVRARHRYECLSPFAGDSSGYGQAVLLGTSEPCRRGAIAQLRELRREAGERLLADGSLAEDERFFAERNAEILAGAEDYYRTMFGNPPGSWNRRDRHMADTVDRLLAHLDRHGGNARIVVWAHNSHVGDARATERAQRGEFNLGQLMRERHGGAVVNVGFTTFEGTVTAASKWGGAVERHRVRPALPGSYEALLHGTGMRRFLLCPLDAGRGGRALLEPRLERAIGAVYRPERERQSHWFEASLALQFDALVHLDLTRAVEPLERGGRWDLLEPPEIYPGQLADQ